MLKMVTVNAPWCFWHFRRIQARMQESRHVRGCASAWELGGRVDDLLWSSPGRQQHSIILDLPDDTSRENTLSVSCRLAFFCCLLFIIFRAALPRGQVTICILSPCKFSQNCLEYVFFYCFIFLCISFPPTSLLKRELLMVFTPYMSPFADDSAGWCQTETNREQRCTLDKRWKPSEGNERIEGGCIQPIWSACLSFRKKKRSSPDGI